MRQMSGCVSLAHVKFCVATSRANTRRARIDNSAHIQSFAVNAYVRLAIYDSKNGYDLRWSEMIKKISVKNFRSLKDTEINLEALNIFVGQNDAGKSNILKALNLFFNGQSDFSNRFDFESDFCKFAAKVNRKAAEIVIRLEIQPPASYSLTKPHTTVFWEKRWRRSGPHSDQIKYPNGDPIQDLSRVNAWARKFRYRYVPAVKGQDYFQSLLQDLHDTLLITVSAQIKQAAANFVKTIQEHTADVSTEINSLLRLDSQINMPPDLRVLFGTLDFQTKKNAEDISLQKRGDGIKSRHIPIILKFLCEAESKHQEKGTPKITNVWGYEEPENSLELSKTFELAENFLAYSKRIQMLVTSHSPGFYAAAQDAAKPNGKTRLFYVEYDDADNSTKHVDKTTIPNELDASMGLLPLVAPYVDKKQNELSAIFANKLSQQVIPELAICVEGPSDVNILTKALEQFGPKLYSLIKAQKVKFLLNPQGSGHTYVKQMTLGRAYALNAKFRTAAIFDKDLGAIQSKKEVDADSKVEKSKLSGSTITLSLEKPPHLNVANLSFYFAIEEIIKIETWKYAETKGWLEPRPDISKFCNVRFGATETAISVLTKAGLKPENQIYVSHQVELHSKEAFAKHIGKLSNSDAKIQLEYLDKICQKLEDFFA
ncbi:MAG: AAA family ATPase [Turneriella sp.]|nr:AAA family ATPase [Turneriella sp.]